MKNIGPSFGDELIAAGCNDGVSFTVGGTDADILYSGDADVQAVAQVIATHDPSVAGQRMPDALQVLTQAVKSKLGLTDADLASAAAAVKAGQFT